MDTSEFAAIFVVVKLLHVKTIHMKFNADSPHAR